MVPLPDGEETISGNEAQVALGGTGAGGAGNGLLEGAHVTVIAGHA